jgi:hypothetical protein
VRPPSLCESCALMREVVTPKGSRFFLCTMSATDRRYAKYPPQPIVRCEGYRSVVPRGGAAGAVGEGPPQAN